MQIRLPVEVPVHERGEVQAQALTFAVEYVVDVSEELVGEMLHLKAIHRENLGKDILSPLIFLTSCRKRI